MCQRLSACYVQSAPAVVCLEQITELFQNIIYFFGAFKGTVILLIAMLTPQVAAMCDMPLKCKICIIEIFHCQNDELPPLPQLLQLEPLEQLEQLEPLEQLEQLLPELDDDETGGLYTVVWLT